MEITKEKEGLALIVFSGDMDKVLAALNVATGFLSSGKKVTLFFTFWGTSLLKSEHVPTSNVKKKHFLQKIFSWMLPRGTKALPLSRHNCGGIGSWAMRYLMKKYHFSSPSELLQSIIEEGGNIFVCTTSLDLMGISQEELISTANLQYCGVAKFMEIAQKAEITLFI